MCGRVGAVSVNWTRCFGLSTMNASTSATTTTISHQYSRIKSIRSPIPLCVVTTAKLDQIGEQEPEKKAQYRDCRTFGDQRQGAATGRPACVAHAWDIFHQANELDALEVVRLAGKQDLPCERVMMQVRADLRHFIIDGSSASVALDFRREPIGSPQRSMPESRCDERKDDPDCQREIASRLQSKSNRAGDHAEQEARSEHRPEVGPESVHAPSRASSRQPMSRRWKPSAKSIWSTARYARARALANVSATAVTASTRPPFATSAAPLRAVPAWKTVTPSTCSAASISRMRPPAAGVPG